MFTQLQQQPKRSPAWQRYQQFLRVTNRLTMVMAECQVLTAAVKSTRDFLLVLKQKPLAEGLEARLQEVQFEMAKIEYEALLEQLKQKHLEAERYRAESQSLITLLREEIKETEDEMLQSFAASLEEEAPEGSSSQQKRARMQ